MTSQAKPPEVGCEILKCSIDHRKTQWQQVFLHPRQRWDERYSSDESQTTKRTHPPDLRGEMNEFNLFLSHRAITSEMLLTCKSDSEYVT